MRIIDADALIKQIKSSSAYNDYEWSMYADGFIEDIDSAPTIEPKRGEWKVRGNPKRNLWECSLCRCTIYSESESDRNKFHKWCGRCGARMKGADDE